MKLKFEHDFQQKIMLQRFEEPMEFLTASDVQKWRSLWMQELKSWHSPYKLILDCSNINLGKDIEVREAVTRMIKFFEGLFLKSVTGYGSTSDEVFTLYGFKMVPTFEDAQAASGVRGMRDPKAPQSFRDSIQFQNHFAQHVIEVSFSDDVIIDDKSKIEAFKSKLTNNLMQWHSKWSLLIDCSRVQFSQDLKTDWQKLEGFFRNFFMKAVIGYSPSDQKRDNYPFETYRARHAAVAKLESEGHFMGNEAHCKSKGDKK